MLRRFHGSHAGLNHPAQQKHQPAVARSGGQLAQVLDSFQGQTRGIDLTVQQREVRLNAPTPPRTFERRLPPGARPVDLDMTAPPRLELPAAPAPAQTQDNAAPAP